MKDRSGGARFVEAACASCAWKGKLHLRGVEECPRCGAQLGSVTRAELRGARAPRTWRSAAMMALTVLVIAAGTFGTLALIMWVAPVAGVAGFVVTLAATLGTFKLYQPVVGWSAKAVWAGDAPVDAEMGAWLSSQGVSD